MEKTFKTIKEQIDILKNKNLDLDDCLATKILEDNNYYFLINGYKELFLDKSCLNEKFKKGTSLKEIFNLYEFDRKIRIKMIMHYIDTYNFIPLWVLIRILSFGKVSKFYSLMKPREQSLIGKKFNIKSEKMKIYLTNLGEIRNICAHDEKLYDIRLRFKISNNIYHSKLNIPKFKGNYLLGLQDLFSIVLILKDMLTKNEFQKFYKLLNKRIYELSKFIITINFNDILKKMGFPFNYKKLIYL